MAATTIHIDLFHALTDLVVIASCATLVMILVDLMVGRLPPKERQAIGRTERFLASCVVVFVALGPLYLIHLVTKANCS